ncbi:FAD-dependent oxidoreductase, partial [candidate division WWE3 bacterium]|nr:FAD-dependent oxidoreductase [candidate division WWE3 bacterium]
NLDYFKGGFQKVATILAETITQQGGTIQLESSITKTSQTDTSWDITYIQNGQEQTATFDRIIVTSPMPVFQKLFPQLPDNYTNKYHSLTGIGAHVLVLVLKQSLLPKNIYWLNIHDYEWPFLVAAEHTHFADPTHYGGDTILYVGDYLPAEHELMQLTKDELIETFSPYLQKINPAFTRDMITKSWLWRTPYAQPIVTVNHSQHIPPLDTPLPGVYLANMSQVYPWDRGTNYAVELGQAVAELADK